MSNTLSWGKPTIEVCPSVNGVPTGSWRKIPTPKEDTTKITPTAGKETTAVEEGGEIIATRVGKTTYTLEFDLFVTPETARPFEDEDGLISGEYAIRITPENPQGIGITIERASVRVEEGYTSAEGITLHYVARVLKPAEGKQLKPFTAKGLKLDKYELNFGNAADTTGKVVTATSSGNVTATTTSDAWITLTTSGKATTIKVSANTTGARRVGYVAITADKATSLVEVLQIPA